MNLSCSNNSGLLNVINYEFQILVNGGFGLFNLFSNETVSLFCATNRTCKKHCVKYIRKLFISYEGL